MKKSKYWCFAFTSATKTKQCSKQACLKKKQDKAGDCISEVQSVLCEGAVCLQRRFEDLCCKDMSNNYPVIVIV